MIEVFVVNVAGLLPLLPLMLKVLRGSIINIFKWLPVWAKLLTLTTFSIGLIGIFTYVVIQIRLLKK